LAPDLPSVTINGKACTVAGSESQQTSNWGIGKSKRLEGVGGVAALGTRLAQLPEAARVPPSVLEAEQPHRR